MYNNKAIDVLKSGKGELVLDEEIGSPLLIASYFKKHKSNILILASSLNAAQKIYDTLISFISNDDVYLFPSDELLRIEAISSSKDLLAERLFTMSGIIGAKNKILIITPASILLPLPLPSLFRKSFKKVRRGDKYNLQTFKEELVKMGYENVSKIDQSLQFASRGDILDVFPVNCAQPVRIEFFGDEVDEIRSFQIATQESTESLVEVDILPANEFLFSEKEIAEIPEKLKNLGLEADDSRFSNILNYQYSSLTLRYYRSLKDEYCSILSYFDYDLFIFTNVDKFDEGKSAIRLDTSTYLRQLFDDGSLAYQSEIYLRDDEIIIDYDRVIKGHKFVFSDDIVRFETTAIFAPKVNNLMNLSQMVDTYIVKGSKTIFALSNKIQYDTITSILKEKNLEYEMLEGLSLPTKQVGITLFPLVQGFELKNEHLIYVTSGELFNYHHIVGKYLSHFKEATILKSYDELQSGDYIVHEYNGIGKFLDIKTMIIDGIHRDFLHILYANNEYLYVPLEQFRLVRKFAGKEGFEPKLSSLSNDSWSKKKKKIKERISDMADKLYDLYKLRNEEIGYAYPQDDELQEMFESEFPYELTEDQKTSIEEIKIDQEKPIAMDRLLCGDVGFGKTEIAFRAAFKVIEAGKQVAILCPTIILARQHYIRALERFANYGIHIVLLSRLVSAADQTEIFKEIESGKANLIIATHRIFSKDLVFHDLGLLIVDEEQRFGVKQKEQIKLLKNNIDVLSLSATPIPRTLQLSLVGIRSISQINTPPPGRSPIQTYVLPYRLDIVLDLIKREIRRKGQVFYVKNDIRSLNSKQRILMRELPDITFGLINGQMEKEEIEDIMNDFYNGDIDVLMATSIIENGIDIPNVNLLIVEDADHFGLSQLYQIKGRVGRGSRIAYAYFMYAAGKNMTKQAEKRLKAIQDFNELGSGYKIAQRDLLIRGAGDILGDEQAGFIDMIGMDLYIKLLNEVIEEKKTGVAKKEVAPVTMLSIDAYIPETYANKEEKIEIYQSIDDCKNIKELAALKSSIRDIYGKIPAEVDLLLRKRAISINCSNEPFKGIQEESTNIALTFSKKFSSKNGVGVKLFEVLEPYIDKIKVYFLKKTLIIRLEKTGNWLKDLETIISICQKVDRD